jgi:Fe-Mn family superoxide dismutase
MPAYMPGDGGEPDEKDSFGGWEHALHLQYRNRKSDFVEAMWQVVNWQDVARRYEAAKSRGNALLLAP